MSILKKSFFYRTLVAVSKSREVFRNQSNIYKEDFFAKIINGYKMLTIFADLTIIADIHLCEQNLTFHIFSASKR